MTAKGAAPINPLYLNHADVQALAMSDAEIIAAVETGLSALGVASLKRSHDVRERLLGLGANPVGNTPAALGAMLRREHAVWGEVVRRAGIKAK